MAYIKLVNETYPKEIDVMRLAWYIFNLNKCTHEVYGGRNILIEDNYNPIYVGEQFCSVQRVQSFQRGVYHLVISFDPVIDNATLMFANNVGKCICNLYSNYQSFYAVHEDTGMLHIHMMINNCPIFEGVPKLTNVFNIMTVRRIVDEMIDKHLGIK